MFKKLSNEGKVPSNNGDTNPMTKVDSGAWVKVYELELTNMENSPTYPLTHQLSIGSEIGNVVIADPSISPRHCTFILQQGVISVLDHGSVSGTFINGTKILAGKYIILEETDIVVIGELEVRIKSKTIEQEEDIIPDIPLPARVDTLILSDEDLENKNEEDRIDGILTGEKVEQELQAISLGIDTAKSKIFTLPKSFKSGKGKKAKTKFKEPTSATNSVLRVCAVVGDLLLSYSIYVVFNPFDEFRSFLEFIPSFLNDLIAVDWNSLWVVLTEDYSFLRSLGQGSSELLANTFHILPILLVFVLLRFISTLFFGISVSEVLMGIRGRGNGIWKRIGGALRVLVGVVTGPFLIFDMPSIISKRTLKEFLTFTNTFVSSKFFAFVGVIFIIPLLLVMALFAPLIQGLESVNPIIVNDRIDQRIKLPVAENPVGAPEKILVKDNSQSYKLALDYSPQELTIVPLIKFKERKSKTRYQNQLAFHHKELQRTVTLEVYKKFDLKQLLGIGLKGNYFLFSKYPQIHNFVYSSTETHPALKSTLGPREQDLFSNELISLIKTSFGLSLDNAVEVMQEETALLKSLVEYRAAFMALLEYKDFQDIGFIKIGNVVFMKVSYMMQKPFDLIIPLVQGEGRIYKVEFDKKDNLSALSTKFYKYTLFDTDWLGQPAVATQEVLTPMQALDLFSSLDFKSKSIHPEQAQALYGYYFEKSSQVLSDAQPNEYALWKESIADALAIMRALAEGVSPTPVENGAVDPRMKLFQNFKDLKDAVEAMDKNYFGINQSV